MSAILAEAAESIPQEEMDDVPVPLDDPPPKEKKKDPTPFYDYETGIHYNDRGEPIPAPTTLINLPPFPDTLVYEYDGMLAMPMEVMPFPDAQAVPLSLPLPDSNQNEPLASPTADVTGDPIPLASPTADFTGDPIPLASPTAGFLDDSLAMPMQAMPMAMPMEAMAFQAMPMQAMPMEEPLAMPMKEPIATPMQEPLAMPMQAMPFAMHELSFDEHQPETDENSSEASETNSDNTTDDSTNDSDDNSTIESSSADYVPRVGNPFKKRRSRMGKLKKGF